MCDVFYGVQTKFQANIKCILQPHLRTHHGKGIFVCPDLDCEGVFQERQSLEDHEFACHPDARPFVCRYCRDRFATLAESLNHEDSDHPEDTSSNCLKCGETSSTKTLAKEHFSFVCILLEYL